jgi:adenylate cyclase
MLEALPELNREFERRNFPRINVGIGINTGEVNVGNMGSDKIFAYTALGDHMNLASRLESLTKYYGANLLISEFTEAKLGEKRSEFCLRALDKVRVKGRSSAITIFEVLPTWHPLRNDKSALQLFAVSYSAYLTRDFRRCIEQLQKLLTQYPGDKASERLLHAAEAFEKNPPADAWDGVTTYETK